ncbi:uncharacterized protein SETTUDRAFT_24032 [Exserohilum turcica Et28A]|uniref:Uncharacterized protein n=1 Tax=Exserohilum turcicum (strain 28A) TaxID=671987 RepID=R0I806_EXST2|nr:uncharacterized protein SETTUDRAFT_24032 [Exserohilum turcica Et28A]EOA81645.1 hypothetical protein SETTUDRAFT_24032 [Exserohilum turcica Et28A]
MSGEAEYAIRGGAASRDHAGASASPEWLSMSMIDFLSRSRNGRTTCVMARAGDDGDLMLGRPPLRPGTSLPTHRPSARRPQAGSIARGVAKKQRLHAKALFHVDVATVDTSSGISMSSHPSFPSS